MGLDVYFHRRPDEFEFLPQPIFQISYVSVFQPAFRFDAQVKPRRVSGRLGQGDEFRPGQAPLKNAARFLVRQRRRVPGGAGQEQF